MLSAHLRHVLAVLLAVEVLGCGVLVLPRVRWWGLLPAAGLLVAGAWWAGVDKAAEGGVIISFSASHGLVVSDPLSVQAGIVACAIVGRFLLQSLPFGRRFLAAGAGLAAVVLAAGVVAAVAAGTLPGGLPTHSLPPYGHRHLHPAVLAVP